MKGKMIIQNCRMLVFSLMDENQNILALPKGDLAGLDLSVERLKILSDTLRLLMETDMISDVTKTFISGRWTNKTLAEWYSDKGFDMTAAKVSSKIWYDCGKIATELGETFITDICYRQAINLSDYQDKLMSAYEKYNEAVKIEKYLAVKIDNDYGITKVLSDEQFEELLGVLEKCSKKYLNGLIDSLQPEQLAYVTYITTYLGLSKNERERLSKLIETIE